MRLQRLPCRNALLSKCKKNCCLWAMVLFFLFYLFFIWLLVTSFTSKPRRKSWLDKESNNYEDSNSTGRLHCACEGLRSEMKITTDFISTCGQSATARGPKQSVVTYSLFGQNIKYFQGISKNAELIPKYYPGWVMRVYYHLEVPEIKVREELCSLWCDFPHLDFCPVKHLPSPLFDQRSLEPRMWRFLVLGDPLVDRFVSRDLDSLITERELTAVNEWIMSGKTWHFMRDHPLQAYPIMAGMWGAINTDRELNTFIREDLIDLGQYGPETIQDQTLLARVLLPIVETSGDYINHDSYHCQSLAPKNAQPWPVQRAGKMDFVGNPVLRFKLKISAPCPKQCRPPQHQDWKYC